MRVRPNRTATEQRRRSGVLRRTHAPVRNEPPAPAPVEPDLADERRARESGGPEDNAMYTCTCGYVFEAKVSTSVACPHCGAGQAW
jgi:rubrerythrin